MITLGAQPFTTSSYSGPNGACVEVGSSRPATVEISDSKIMTSDKPVVAVSPAAFAAMIAHIRG